mmetsp:Transcript_23741/g.20641  ORF Transcript_23741/g.20641 Transcript_23741/m.20641 type:complete len:238 (-) Transcript_23741:491-1204(-)
MIGMALAQLLVIPLMSQPPFSLESASANTLVMLMNTCMMIPHVTLLAPHTLTLLSLTVDNIANTHVFLVVLLSLLMKMDLVRPPVHGILLSLLLREFVNPHAVIRALTLLWMMALVEELPVTVLEVLLLTTFKTPTKDSTDVPSLVEEIGCIGMVIVKSHALPHTPKILLPPKTSVNNLVLVVILSLMMVAVVQLVTHQVSQLSTNQKTNVELHALALPFIPMVDVKLLVIQDLLPQ